MRNGDGCDQNILHEILIGAIKLTDFKTDCPLSVWGYRIWGDSSSIPSSTLAHKSHTYRSLRQDKALYRNLVQTLINYLFSQ